MYHKRSLKDILPYLQVDRCENGRRDNRDSGGRGQRGYIEYSPAYCGEKQKDMEILLFFLNVLHTRIG